MFAFNFVFDSDIVHVIEGVLASNTLAFCMVTTAR